MEEKKIKDMTGNREEKIASKKPVKDTAVKDAPRAPKRPFVRMAQPGADMTEKISKKAEPAQEAPAKNGGKNEKRPTERPSKENGEKREKRGDKTAPRRDNRNRRNNDRKPQTAEPETVKTETAENEQTASPERREKRRDNRHERRNEKRAENRNESRKNENHAEKREQKEETVGAEKSVPNAGGRRSKRGEPRAERQHRQKGNAETLPTEAVPGTVRVREEEFTDEQLRADGLLFTLDEEPKAAPAESVPAEEPAEEERFEVVGIRFRGTGKTYYFSPNGITFVSGEHAIVETVRGMEYGDIVLGNRLVGASEVVQPLKPVVRKATPEDDAHDRSNRALEENAKPVFHEKVKKNKLEMQLVDVEYTFDNSKLCFYFTAEGRVDFRELVKDLASVFRTRIELRQIGVRDEARLFGGLGVCGRPFCCKSFLSDFVQVSIKMAKEQNLSLASAKISGSCGRLMCCLRYEQDTYEREAAALPRVNSIVDTPKGRATVLESNFLTGKIKVSDANDGTIRYFTPEEVRFVAPPPRKTAQEEEIDAETAALTEE